MAAQNSSVRKNTRRSGQTGTGRGRRSSTGHSGRQNSAPQGTGSSAKKSGRAGNAEDFSVEESTFQASQDVKVISGFVVMVLLLLSNFHLVGRVGNLVSRFLFGLFGLFAYVVPILIFIGVCFYIANTGNRVAMKKLVAGIIGFEMLCAVLQWVYYSSAWMGTGLADAYRYSRNMRNGGGFFGGLVVVPLCKLLGLYGSIIVIFGVLVACIVVVSERSLVDSVRRHSREAYDYAKEDVKRIRENSELKSRRKKQQKSLVRAKKTVRGVAVNPRVTKEAEIDADVHELLTSGALYRGHINEDDMEGTLKEEETIGSNSGFYSGDTTAYAGRGEMSQSDVLESSEVAQRGYDGSWKTGQNGYVESQEMTLSGYAESREISPSGHTEEEGSLVADINRIWSRSSANDVVLKAEEEEQARDVERGEFQPKERLVISKEAKEVMKRRAFAGTSLSVSNDLPVPDVNEGIVAKAVNPNQVAVKNKSKEYVMPPLTLLRKGKGFKSSAMRAGQISETAMKLQQTLEAFGVKATVINESRGPSVTRYELQPETGTKVSKITALSDDIKLNLAASDIRIEAPIPGKAAVGIEVPNDKRESVFLRDLIESQELSKHPSKLAFAAGMDIAGKVVVADIAKMPHMLIAGTTGSGKSVFTNSIIMSILFRAKPSEVKLIIVDPKVVEFGVYNGIPHLLSPVVTDPRKAAGALNWAVGEMSERYKLFANYNVRDLKGYNEKIKQMGYRDGEEVLQPKPQIVIIIDELADLMMVASKEVEAAICRLAQLARAAGIHLIIATQRPSVDVVTGLIKANIPSRVALLVSSGTDSRTIIDSNGGEKLLGNGDMLFYPSGYVKPVRLQGAFVSDEEVQNVVRFLIDNNQDVEYNDAVTSTETDTDSGESGTQGGGDDKDVLFDQAARFVIEKERASTSMLQRMFKIGFNRAARIVDQLEKAGIVGADEGTKPRKVLVTMEEYERM